MLTCRAGHGLAARLQHVSVRNVPHMPDTSAAIRAAIDADAAVHEAAEMADWMHAYGAYGAAAALYALTRDRKARADRVWKMTERTLHAGAVFAQQRARASRR